MSDDKPKTFNRDSMSNTLVVAIGVSLVCSILVASAAVVLKPRQQLNEEEYRQRIVLDVAGLYESGINIGEAYTAAIERTFTPEFRNRLDAVINFDVIEHIQPANADRFVAKLDYINYQYDYSGSGWLLGAPKKLDSTPMLGYPTYDEAQVWTVSMTARF